MKTIIKGAEPPSLTRYREQHPKNTWEEFRGSRSRRRTVQEALRADQGNLCAYCEIDMLKITPGDLGDFQVEHFHPKSDEDAEHNWNLDWNNLLGCCYGGSERGCANSATRFTAPDLSCGAAKENKNLDGIILNPIVDIPAFPLLFKFQRTTGNMLVDIDHCSKAQIAVTKAQSTIDELHLNSPRLKRMRTSVLEMINDRLQMSLKNGEDISDARYNLAKVYLKKDDQGYWTPFFSTIRCYLGSDAEKFLHDTNYEG